MQANSLFLIAALGAVLAVSNSCAQDAPTAPIAPMTKPVVKTGSKTHSAVLPPPEESVMIAPRILPDTCPIPPYPRTEMDKGNSGIVKIKFEVSATGEALKAEVAASSSFPLLDQAAVMALKDCKFQPAMMNGQPIAAVTVVNYEWKMGKKANLISQ